MYHCPTHLSSLFSQLKVGTAHSRTGDEGCCQEVPDPGTKDVQMCVCDCCTHRVFFGCQREGCQGHPDAVTLGSLSQSWTFFLPLSKSYLNVDSPCFKLSPPLSLCPQITLILFTLLIYLLFSKKSCLYTLVSLQNA